MKQYLNLLQEIKERGTHKPPAREGMPGSRSLFGYQLRHNLQDGFPLLTTKKMNWKAVVVELLWFLRGDTNIKYLLDNNVNIWNEDAYNYYLKVNKNSGYGPFPYDYFLKYIKEGYISPSDKQEFGNYKLGDCGFQYGKMWRNWEGLASLGFNTMSIYRESIDQIANVIKSLRESPEGRRHIVTAIDPAHQDDLALYWCHALFQFNCRPLNTQERVEWALNNNYYKMVKTESPFNENYELRDSISQVLELEEGAIIPKYYLDCQLYQRSCDFFLGGPFNIASYALLTHVLAEICNMQVGDLIISYGDIHLYEDHISAAKEQLSREVKELPKLILSDRIKSTVDFHTLDITDFKLENYNSYPAIKAKLSTGLK